MQHRAIRISARAVALGLAFALLPSGAVAEIYKCKDAAGGVVYTDVKCPGGEVLQPTETSVIPLSRPAPPAGVSTTVKLVPEAPAKAPAPYIVTSEDRQRIANLEQVLRNADNPQKRQAARMEIAEIHRGTVARMSYDDLRRKDSYWVDLSNPDEQRRRVAVTQLADLFARYR